MSTAPNRNATPQRKRYGVCTGDKDPNCKKCKSKETQEFSTIDKFECKECGSTVRQVPPPPPPSNWKKYALIGVGILALGGGGYFLFSGKNAQPVYSIVVDTTEVTDTIGKTIVIKATTTPPDAQVTWSSSDPNIAMVTDGQVALLNEGNAEIICALNDTAKATTNVTVVNVASSDTMEENPIYAITVEPVEVTDTVGKTIELKATPTPTDAKLTWSSSDPGIAVVDGGKVALQKEGKVEITCSINDSTKAVTAVTIVKKKGGGGDQSYVKNYSLSYGSYTGPATNGIPDGINGEVKVTRGFNLDLKSGGATLRLEPGDRIVNCKFRNGKIVQGFLKRANGEGKNFNIGI